jgi:thiosulfate reductase cytochrome b subunit
MFVAAPVSIFSGLMQSPAISNALGWLGQLLNRQPMRSIHFISFAWSPGFTHHPLTIHAAAHMMDLIERSSRFR